MVPNPILFGIKWEMNIDKVCEKVESQYSFLAGPISHFVHITGFFLTPNSTVLSEGQGPIYIALGSTTWIEPWALSGSKLPSGGNQLNRVLLSSSQAYYRILPHAQFDSAK
jgi:hypothetical protein